MTKTMVDDDNTDSAEHLDDGPSEWQKPLWIASAIFLLALVGIAVWLVATKPAKVAPKTTQGAQQRPSSEAGVQTQRSSSTVCALPAGDQTVPYDSPPVGITWNEVGSMQAPQAASTLGPERTNGVWNTCFARSPSGALLAAFNLWAEGTAADPSQVFQHLAVGAPKNLGNNDRLDANGPVQFAGYKYESYTPSSAQVIVVIKGYRGAFEAIETTMRWIGADWKYVFPANGTPALQTLPDLTGYVQWSVF